MPIWFDMLVMSDYVPFFILTKCHWGRPFLFRKGPGAVRIRADDGRDIPIMTMGPICITPEYKRQGYGKRLLDFSLEKATELGCPALCFEGNIHFYGKCGFTFARDFGIRYHDLPEGADDSFFLCKELTAGYLKGITGVYAPPEGYFAAERNPEDFSAYDAQFSPKKKLVLPGQLGQA